MARTRLPGRDAEDIGRRLTRGDILAGISVAVLLVPQALAYARLAGMPAHVGLYASALPPVAAALFASSPYLQTGPVALTSLLTFGALSTIASPGTPEYVQLGMLLALVVGSTRILIGSLRIGYIAFLMSEPVLRGFSAAAALLIVASQLPGMLGVEPDATGVVRPAVQALLRPGAWNPLAIALGGGTVALVLLTRRISPRFPAVPVAAASGMALVVLLDAPLQVVGEIPFGLPPLTLGLPWLALPRVAVAGVIIALVGFAEAAAIGRTYANKERQRWDPDRDFISQGAANVAAAVSGGFPVGGSFSRTSLNHMLGATTRWSGAITGLTVLLFLPFAGVLAPLPVAVLSGIVISAVASLLHPRPITVLWRLSRPQFLIAAITFGLTVLLSPHVEQAVLLGILAAVGFHVWGEFRVTLDDVRVKDDALEIRPEGVLWFGSAETMRWEVLALAESHPDISQVALRLDRFGEIDLTATLVIERLIDDLQFAGLKVNVLDAHPETARALRRVLATSQPV